MMRRSLISLVVLAALTQVAQAGRGALVLKTGRDASTEEDDDLYDDEEEEEKGHDISASAFSKDSIMQQGETRDFLQFLQRIAYDHRQVPEPADGGPVEVAVSIVVSNVRSVSEVTMDYSLELFYRESWRDQRLQYSPKLFKNKTELALHESYSTSLWYPDTFVPNAISSKNPRKQSITHRSLLRLELEELDHEGRILYSRRLSLLASCSMDLTLFPFDSQLCKLGIESYGYTADKVVYKWSKGARAALKLDPISLPDFQITEAYVTSRMESYATGVDFLNFFLFLGHRNNSGDYSRLYVCFVFTRAAGFCFLQLIIPSTAVVITSWVSLWMENETSFQDMISIILTITFLLFSYNEVMPRVSYLKAMDVYLGTCFCIVFCALIKLAFVKYMRQNVSKESPKPPSGFLPFTTIQIDSGNSGLPRPRSLGVQFSPKFIHRFHWSTQMIFLIFFASFCLFYFLVYPNIHAKVADQDCDRLTAEWFADLKINK
ncbi:hypothetical protein PRIPAC_79532 [Pristionchus pacificus]|uniref:Transmembrane ion channel n=1 Tax=Pristionchus pacificus TaxID=54126 RepID=A0A2A6BH59_PRIPA|nr:hypothetical protein PRIPAC_79532 [Pristionchus pacificus]|eukprot:PDM65230.1 transmembrane ion channel [Pristionchus pacificus]